MSAAKKNSRTAARKPAKGGDVSPTRLDIVAQNLLRTVDSLVVQVAVCAAAATLVSDDEGERARQAAPCIAPMLDAIRERLEVFHGEIEFLVPENPQMIRRPHKEATP
jgi:hypothetical protein